MRILTQRCPGIRQGPESHTRRHVSSPQIILHCSFVYEYLVLSCSDLNWSGALVNLLITASCFVLGDTVCPSLG